MEKRRNLDEDEKRLTEKRLNEIGPEMEAFIYDRDTIKRDLVDGLRIKFARTRIQLEKELTLISNMLISLENERKILKEHLDKGVIIKETE